MQNWNKSLRYHECTPKGITNFECLLLNLHTLNSPSEDKSDPDEGEACLEPNLKFALCLGTNNNFDVSSFVVLS